MRTVLFAAPYFTDIAIRFVQATVGLAEVRVGLISQEPLDRLPEALRNRVAGSWRVANALDPRELAHAVVGLASQLGGPVHRLLGVVEQIQVPLALVREQLEITGMGVDQALNFRDKARMKTRLREAGLPCARHQLARSEAEAWSFAAEAGYPLVLKPPAGAAAQGTVRVDHAEELRAALRTSPPGPDRELLLEEFVTGNEHSFDTFSLHGEVVFHSLTHYYPTPLEVLRNPWIQWCVLLPREIDEPQYDDIRRAAFQALSVLGQDTGMSHLEWFRRVDGSLAISEVGARPPGAQLTTIISRGHELDTVAAWARLMVDGVFDHKPERRYAVGAAYLRGQGTGRVRAIHGLEQVERELGTLVTDGKLPRVGQEPSPGYEGEGYLILRHPETSVVERALRRLISVVRVELG